MSLFTTVKTGIMVRQPLPLHFIPEWLLAIATATAIALLLLTRSRSTGTSIAMLVLLDLPRAITTRGALQSRGKLTCSCNH